ncbi:MAG TPA: archaellin/type IV pilin N-terminal domain-containing protein [Candidatus Omnitrophota bacterium]|nr:archaellin/type IV pilin N-terminal domain-containing protein [Candidatus Omnitrophota bacterium]
MKNKRGVSEIIGYVLLIAIVVVISIFVYQWLKSYVPQSALTCPDGTAVSISNYKYNCAANANNLSFTLSNDGTFSIAGYFIHASNNSNQTIATIDLSNYYTGPGDNGGGSILLGAGNNLEPGQDEGIGRNTFNLSMTPAIKTGTLTELEVIPIRYVEYNGKQRVANCGNAKISISLSCN